MQLTNSICDYDFAPGERAQYVYFNDAGEERNLVVRVLDWREYPDGKTYIVSAHEKAFKDIGVAVDSFLTDHYFADLAKGHKAAHLDPDELIPMFRQFEVVVDNTNKKRNQ